ncbi:MAG: hypothetical protein V4625_19150 [Pseudomonadota bacterium]
MNTLAQAYGQPSGPLAVKVREPSAGLFYWIVTRLTPRETDPELRVDSSDHPYPTHEAALRAGVASLKALRTEASL